MNNMNDSINRRHFLQQAGTAGVEFLSNVVYGESSGGDSLSLLLYSVFELHALDQLAQASVPSKFVPLLFSRLGQLEDHRQQASAGHTATGLARAQAHSRKGRFD